MESSDDAESPYYSLIRTLERHERSVRCVAFTHDGLRMLSGGDDWVIRVWDHLPGQKCDVRLHTHSVTG
eukprot:13188-Heterococcus_DN1.PRE.1